MKSAKVDACWWSPAVSLHWWPGRIRSWCRMATLLYSTRTRSL